MLKKISVVALSIVVFIFTLHYAITDTFTMNEAHEALQYDNVLRFDVNGPFGSLNPLEGHIHSSSCIFPLLYSYLLILDKNGEAESDLAAAWSYDPATLEWIIHIRDDALFHNNEPVTSVDVKYSLEEGLRKFRPFLFSAIERINLLSDTAFSIDLRGDDPEFLQKISNLEIVPHPQKIAAYLPNSDPVGSGPFKLNHRIGDDEVGLVVNEKYYGAKPGPNKIIFYNTPDKARSWARLLAGKTDIVQEMHPKDYEMIRKNNDKYYFSNSLSDYYSILLYNQNDPLFSDLNVRKALSLAIDAQYIVDKILLGFGVVATGPMGISSPYHDPNLTPMPYDPMQGLDMLKEAGWACRNGDKYLSKQGKYFEFTILVFEGRQIDQRVAEYIQLCLNEVGIKVHLDSLPHKEVSRRYQRNDEFQAVLTELLGASEAYQQPLEYIHLLWGSEDGQKSWAGGFEHPDIRNLLDTIAQCAPAVRKDILQEFDYTLAWLQPGTFLFQKVAVDVISKRFNLPFPFSATLHGIYHLKDASVSDASIMR